MDKTKLIRKISIFLLITSIFLLGWISNNIFSDIGAINLENPLSYGLFIPKDVNSPSNHINEDQIHVFDDRIILDIPNAIYAKFTNTNSMDPVLDSEANSFEIIPTSPEQIQTGDIISYKPKNINDLIVHRVIEINQDQEGWFCKVKGDNLSKTDPEKIRFEQIHGILVGIIY